MGREVAALAAEYGFDAAAFAPGADGEIVIDFAHPDCLDSLLRCSLPLVIGTTGHSGSQISSIQAAAEARPILLSPNFSPGVYALTRAARVLRGLLPGWDAALTECHHAAKRDAPSGTARALASALAIPPDRVHALRGGTVPGVHELALLGPGEHITLRHAAEGRAVFARGALAAARWLLVQPPGMYGMEDWMEAADPGPSSGGEGDALS